MGLMPRLAAKGTLALALRRGRGRRFDKVRRRRLGGRAGVLVGAGQFLLQLGHGGPQRGNLRLQRSGLRLQPLTASTALGGSSFHAERFYAQQRSWTEGK